MLWVWVFFFLFFGPFPRSFLCFLIDMIHSSLCGWVLSSLQPKWRLSVPVADEVNYLRTMLIRRCRLILEWFIPLWKKTLFYVPLYLVFLQGSESITASSSCRSGLVPAQSRAVCFESAKDPSTFPPMDKTEFRFGWLSDIPDVGEAALSLCVLIMKKFFQPHSLKSAQFTSTISLPRWPLI